MRGESGAGASSAGSALRGAEQGGESQFDSASWTRERPNFCGRIGELLFEGDPHQLEVGVFSLAGFSAVSISAPSAEELFRTREDSGIEKEQTGDMRPANCTQ